MPMVNPVLARFVIRQLVWLGSRLAGAKAMAHIHNSGQVKIPKILSVATAVGIGGISLVSLDYADYVFRRHTHELKEELEQERALRQRAEERVRALEQSLSEREAEK